MAVDPRRTRVLNDKEPGNGPVVYWMQRDQRAEDNWALLYAQEVAIERQVPLYVLFTLVSAYGQATWRQYHFMLEGLKETAAKLKQHNIPFSLTVGEPASTISVFVDEHGVGEVVTDMNPLRVPRQWKVAVAKALSVRVSEVDAHNIVPVWEASGKEEFAAHTLRPKLHKKLPDFLTKFPTLKKHPHSGTASPAIKWDELPGKLDVDVNVGPVDWLTPGTAAGKQQLKQFLKERFHRYNEDRNDPTKDALSHLSPYLHFGQLSPQRVALAVRESDGPRNDKEAYLEELIVRRELSDNFCFFNEHYDSLMGAREWAQVTLNKHEKDSREYIYPQDELEEGKTHDELWNAAQRQMVVEGKMHGYLRMYWAKKILEWSKTPAEAIETALYLNDKYELDGRDPNGYVGVMWSIAGVHDRGWPERPIFGKIRYMNYNGAKRKFDVAKFVKQYAQKKSLLND